MVTCGFCARDFEVDRAQPACQACPVGSGCRLIRCPYCGFDNPEPLRWLERLEGWLRGRKRRGLTPADGGAGRDGDVGGGK